MKILRRVCIALVTVGAWLLFARHDSEFDALPFPTAGLTVKMTARVATEGDYHLLVSMPKADHEIALTNETVPCSLSVHLARANQPPVLSEITSLSLASEYGFANVQHYEGTNWHLIPGEYVVEVLPRENCQAAVSRGATMTLEQQVTHPTERYLANQIIYRGGVFALCAGLLGLIVCELTLRKTVRD